LFTSLLILEHTSNNCGRRLGVYLGWPMPACKGGYDTELFHDLSYLRVLALHSGTTPRSPHAEIGVQQYPAGCRLIRISASIFN
jgi:hypothetical protein